ncbi:hypothetical protein C0995_007815, partial [Termitomyces sp. Mi166
FWTFLENGDDYEAITLAMSKLRLRLEDLPRFPLEDVTKDKPPVSLLEQLTTFGNNL